MIKKLVALLFITFVGTNALAAATHTAPAQTLPWGPIRSAGTMWYINNTRGTTSVTFTVNKYLTGRPGMVSDPITFLCDRTYTVNPGNTVTCVLTNYVRGEFQILPQNLKNGSEGSYTVS